MNTIEIITPAIDLPTKVEQEYDPSKYASVVADVLAAPGIDEIQDAYERLHEFLAEAEETADDLGLDYDLSYRTSDRGACVRCAITGRRDLMAEFLRDMRRFRPETPLPKYERGSK